LGWHAIIVAESAPIAVALLLVLVLVSLLVFVIVVVTAVVVVVVLWQHWQLWQWWGQGQRMCYMTLLTYLLTPWCRVLLEKLTGLQLVKKFPSFHGT